MLNLISYCRSGVLGERKWRCGDCGHAEVMPQSCGNRHCPTCLGPRQRIWSEQVCKRLPAVEHFHVVFTLPGELRALSQLNPREVLGVLFAAVAECLKVFMADKWQSQGGFLAVLHTWGQLLQWHPHLHVLVSAGGLDSVSHRWRDQRGDYLFDVHALNQVYRAIFLRRLRVLEEELSWPWDLQDKGAREAWWTDLSRRNWNVYSAATLGHTQEVVRYLAAYTSRVAIAPQRICGRDQEAGTVSFHYRDRRADGEQKVKTLKEAEFVRRFAQHILPKGFQRIRYYGFLHPARYESIRERLPQGGPEEDPRTLQPVCPRCGSANWTSCARHDKVLDHVRAPDRTHLGGPEVGRRSKPMGRSVSLLRDRSPPSVQQPGCCRPRSPRLDVSIVASSAAEH